MAALLVDARPIEALASTLGGMTVGLELIRLVYFYLDVDTKRASTGITNRNFFLDRESNVKAGVVSQFANCTKVSVKRHKTHSIEQ